MAKKRSKQDLIAAEKKRLAKARKTTKKIKRKSEKTQVKMQSLFEKIMGYSQDLVKQDLRKTTLVSTIVFLVLVIIINLQ